MIVGSYIHLTDDAPIEITRSLAKQELWRLTFGEGDVTIFMPARKMLQIAQLITQELLLSVKDEPELI